MFYGGVLEHLSYLRVANAVNNGRNANFTTVTLDLLIAPLCQLELGELEHHEWGYYGARKKGHLAPLSQSDLTYE